MMMIGLACAALTNAHANLGDTYDQSCTRYGGKGTVDEQSHKMVWYSSSSHTFIVEAFVNNRCVQIVRIPEDGYPKSDESVGKTIKAFNSNPKWHASPYGVADSNIAEWANVDNTVIACLTKKGVIQTAYVWWLRSKNLLDIPDYGPAPVEDISTDNAQKRNI